MNDFQKERLEEGIIFSIRQFQKYANLPPVERNNCVVDTLRKLLVEAEKYQTEYAKWETESE